MKINLKDGHISERGKKSPHPLKHFVFIILSGLSFFFHGRARPNSSDPFGHILIVNFGLIGDVLLITPFIKAIRKAFPEATLCVLIPHWSEAVLSYNANIDHLFTYKAFWANPEHKHKLTLASIIETIKTIRHLRRISFDLVINTWFAEQPLTAILLRLLRSKFLVGFEFPYSKKFYDSYLSFDKNLHIVDNFHNVIKWLTQDTRRNNEITSSLELCSPNTESEDDYITYKLNDRKYIVISPYSSEKSKEWSNEKWIILIDHLKSKLSNIDIVITGTSKFLEESNRIVEQSNHPIVNLVGRQNIYQFASLMRKSLLVISVESGTLHIASACKTPVFVLYSRQYNYNQFLPKGTNFDISVIDVPCAQCIYGCKNPICMDHDPLKVINKIDLFLVNLLK